MGTSKSNPGLRSTQLLPPWANDSSEDSSGQDSENNDDENDSSDDSESNDGNLQEGNWSEAKSDITAFTKNRSRVGRRDILKRASKSYVSGSGGARRMSKSAVYGKSAATKLGGALVGFSSSGVKETFNQLGLGDLESMSVEMAFNKLAQYLCSDGATSEESLANIAVVNALSELYDKFDLENKDISNLDSLSKDQINELLESYVSTYIFERWLHELGMSIEGKSISASEVASFENEIKEFIVSDVNFKLGDKDLTAIDFNGNDGKKIIDSIFDSAYELIETL